MVPIDFDFDKPTISKGILNFLSENLKEDPDTNRDVVKKNLKESLAILAKGKKLDYGSANNLLHTVLRALNLEDSAEEDEIALIQTQPADDDLNYPSSQLPMPNGVPKTPKLVQKEEKATEICRFYTRGHCNRNGNCRFEHPSICKNFRQFGNKATDPKGCDENCENFHPNACRSSLQTRTCSWKDCRFFHLKGTRMINKDQNNDSNQNWRQSQQSRDQGRSRPGSSSSSNQNGPKTDSKNRQPGLNLKDSNRKKKKKNQSPAQNAKTSTPPKVEQVTQEEKKQLGQTLEAIMKRLTAMESRQAYFPQQGAQLQPQMQPRLSPAVTQPGTQTQFQWGSPCPWTQTHSHQ